MSIIRTIAVAVAAMGIAGAASAASNFHNPAMVKDIISGEIFNRDRSDGEREAAVLYAVGFAGAFNRRCSIFDSRVSARFDDELSDHARAGKDDLDAGRPVNPRTSIVVVGYEDGEKLAAEYGCHGMAAAGTRQTLRRLFKGA